MLRKVLKYAGIILVLALVGYQSIYIRRLDEVTPATTAAAAPFNAPTYAASYMHTRLPAYLEKSNTIPDINSLLQQLATHPAEACKKYGKAPLGGDTYYFLVKGEGKVKAIEEEYHVLTTAGGSIKLANAFVIGNAARDASGLVQVNDFNNTMDLNNVSEEINTLIRKEILPSVQQAKQGSTIRFTGCFELKQPTAAAPFADSNIVIIPLKPEIKP